MKKLITNHSIVLFFLMAYSISWGGIVASFGSGTLQTFQGENVLTGDFSGRLLLIWLSMLAGPSISGILLIGLIDGRPGLKHLLRSIAKWRVNIKWYAASLLLFPIVLLLIFYSLSFISPKYFPSSLLGFGLVVGITGGFFEEIGWTGFATPKLQLKFGFLKASVILGIVHSMWHLFADFLGGVNLYKELYLFHFFLWIIALTTLRLFIMWIYNHTRSLFLAQLTHASFTGSQIILTPSILNGPETILWYSVFVISLALLVYLIVRKDKNILYKYVAYQIPKRTT